MNNKSALVLLITILSIGAFFRFYQIAEIPPGLYPDEAMNGNNALEALATGDFKVFYPENNGREGLFINLQAVSLKLFGNEPWALRLVSAIFGTLTILGVYLLTRELFGQSLWLRNTKNLRNYETGDDKLSYIRTNSYFVALLSSFFLAVSFWHINFSRIGFRAIMVPFLATFAIYFLLKGLRPSSYSSSEVEKLPNEKSYENFSTSSKSIIYLTLAGIFTGLGLQTYIAFRFMPFALLVPIVWYLWRWKKKEIAHCIPCATLLFIFVAFVTVLPLGFYFLQNPQDFIGRAGDVAIFSAQSPLAEFLKSNLATAGMFFAKGDCNWRHNFNCQPFLLNGILLIIGLAVLIRNFFGKTTNYPPAIGFASGEWRAGNLQPATLLAWLFFMSLPATLTREGLPHTLRSIGLIPPVMILSGFGAWWLYQKAIGWLEKQKIKWPTYEGQLNRVKKEVALLAILVLILIPVVTYRNYFVRWASNENTYFSFSTDVWHLGQYLKGLPPDTKKYIVVNQAGTDVRGIPMPAQTVMFATDSFREAERQRKNIEYVLPQNIDIITLRAERSEVEKFSTSANNKIVVAFLDGKDRDLILTVQKKFPNLKIKIPSDFVILEN